METCTSGSEGGPQKPTASKDRQGAAARPLHNRRLYEYCGDIPPAHLEAAYYAQKQRPAAG